MNKYEKFWQWFVRNERELVGIAEARPQIYPKVIEAIHEVDHGLVCDFEIGTPSEQNTVVISADGKISLFPTVMRLVDFAPTSILSNWKVVAFRQPRDSHFNLLFEDVAISSDQVMLTYRETKTNKLEVELFIDGVDMDLPALEALGLVLLDNTVGEYHTATHIERIAVRSFVRNREMRDDWLPLIRFPQVVSSLFLKD
jgi:hypothetical protein